MQRHMKSYFKHIEVKNYLKHKNWIKTGIALCLYVNIIWLLMATILYFIDIKAFCFFFILLLTHFYLFVCFLAFCFLQTCRDTAAVFTAAHCGALLMDFFKEWRPDELRWEEPQEFFKGNDSSVWESMCRYENNYYARIEENTEE